MDPLSINIGVEAATASAATAAIVIVAAACVVDINMCAVVALF